MKVPFVDLASQYRAAGVLLLPIFPGLGDERAEYVCCAVNEIRQAP
jgi:hypothetical protein